MSVTDRLKNWWYAHQVQEGDAPADTTDPQRRDTGGDPNRQSGDAHSTTGTGVNETFVGRAAGTDEGYAGETGAEARAEAERDK
ncbi:hypothetical protein [Kribbella sp. NPDC051770]|uniref:hypothetical protein n=1 Tax=Kribbella sp. NPDC051770 TaxID=3155413 RepID=UPI00341BB911